MLGGVLGTIGNKGNIPEGSYGGIGGGIVGGALSIFKGGNSSTNGQTSASQKSITGQASNQDNPAGTTTQPALAAAAVATITPLNSALLPTDVADLESLSASNTDQISLLNSKIADAKTLQPSYLAEFGAAAASGGQDAVDAVNSKYASLGYQDPNKLQANLTVLQSNQTTIDTALKTANQISAPNQTLAKDDNTTGPQDPSAALNTAKNQDTNITQQPVIQTASANTADSWYE